MVSPLGSKKTLRLLRMGLLCAFLVLACAGDSDYPENIILFIGDGMGVAHITAGKIVQGELNLERFSVSGLVTPQR
jgi:alkaline phosphatase